MAAIELPGGTISVNEIRLARAREPVFDFGARTHLNNSYAPAVTRLQRGGSLVLRKRR